jgi:hypothetical protein
MQTFQNGGLVKVIHAYPGEHIEISLSAIPSSSVAAGHQEQKEEVVVAGGSVGDLVVDPERVDHFVLASRVRASVVVGKLPSHRPLFTAGLECHFDGWSSQLECTIEVSYTSPNNSPFELTFRWLTQACLPNSDCRPTIRRH